MADDDVPNAAAREVAPGTQTLVRVLGAELVALITGHGRKTVAGWAAGSGPSRAGDVRRVAETLRVVQELLEVEAPETVRAWFMGMNPSLDDVSPAEAVAEGRAPEAMAAARAFVESG